MMVGFARYSVVVALVSLTAASLAPGLAASGLHPPNHDLESAASGAAQTDRSTVLLPCIPVGVYWEGDGPAPGTPPGPQLAVVRIDVRPKDARVYLDGRFIGRARYFNGKKGYLFLEPGSYRLEIRHQGYQAVAMDLDAEKQCRYDLKHRLARGGGGEPAENESSYGRGKPLNTVFGPR